MVDNINTKVYIGAHQISSDYSIDKATAQIEKNGTDPDGKQRKKLENSCKEFESVLVGQMFAAMRKTIGKNEMNDGGMGEEIFTGMMDTETAKNFSSSGGFGIWKPLYGQMLEQLSRSANPSEVKIPAVPAQVDTPDIDTKLP